MLSHCIIQGPLKKWTKHFLKLQLRENFGKTPGTPFGLMFWTLSNRIKIFLMWGQAVTVKVFLPYLKMSLYYHHKRKLMNAFWDHFFSVQGLLNFLTLKFSGIEVQYQFLGQYLGQLLGQSLEQCLEQSLGQFLGQFFGQFF